MYDPVQMCWTILALLLGSAIVSAVLSRTAWRKAAAMPLVAAGATSAVFALLALSQVANVPASEGRLFVDTAATWFAAGKLVVHATITVDPLSSTMLAMITFVSTWIAVFSSGYMHGDKGYGRFFTYMSLFVFSMCGLVLSNNFLFLIAFWEGVGLCSYLLVGYYFEKPSAAAAARKAFLVTRMGDVGFILGVFLLWRAAGWNTDITTAFEYINRQPPDPATLTAICLLLFCGAVGKSAQFPLYVWLPDAMEGPTPVSALIHAATMVTAGAYLLARCAPLFARSPDAQIVVTAIGAFTALLASFIALAQYDLKRVLAYSTVSQLGYMFMSLGTGGAISPTLAVTAALFHLITHAFFKALLFLSAGSVMHAMGGVIDMRQFSGLRKVMPITHITFLCGAAALAAVPPLSGFWSKDLIMDALSEAGDSASPYAVGYSVILAVAFLTAFLTAFYTFRAYFLTFWGPERIPAEAGHHAHESPSVMTVPLVVLAFGAVGAGLVLQPFTHWFSDFLDSTPSVRDVARLVNARPVEHNLNWTIGLVGTAIALGGAGLAFGMYRRGEPLHLPGGVKRVFSLSLNRLYVEEIYEAVIVKPAIMLSYLAKAFDGFTDGLARLISAIPRFIGWWARPIQNGLVQFYALSMALGLAVFLTFVIFRAAR